MAVVGKRGKIATEHLGYSQPDSIHESGFFYVIPYWIPILPYPTMNKLEAVIETTSRLYTQEVKTMMRKNRWFLLLSTLLLAMSVVSGCASKGDGKQEKLALFKQTNPKPMDIIDVTDSQQGLEEQVKKEVAKFDSIYDVVIVKNEKKMIVAYKVKQLKRFKMKKIEKALKKHLNDQFKDTTFIVSSDYKIFLEAVRLNTLLRDNDIPEKKAKKKFEDIVKLQKELT